MNESPQVSVVIEWANVRLAGAPRAQAMLRALGREARSSPRRLEILLCHEESERPELQLDEYGLPSVWRTVAVPDGDYYEMKNHGARAARGDLLVFLDSDVVPEPGWLEAILRPLEDPAMECVAGRASIDPEDWYAAAFALFWFFPLRAADEALRETNHFWANNVAFRRGVFLAHPFPGIDGTSRGACVALARRLSEAGVKIWESGAAHVTHPAPRRGRHFVWRALAQGRDRVLRQRGWKATPAGSLAWFALRTLRGWGCIVLHQRRVGLPWRGAPYAGAVCLAYFALAFAGELATFLRVPAIRRVQV